MTMLYARWLNQWAGTAYTFEQVAEYPPILFEMLAAIQRGLDPPKVT